ncbi:HlyD family secretion protein [Fusibacter ferrireducens]|uniref:HlyD family secretion protein n=1 Tax=Fusibacter ferrireducens TaxID=2785058 RepID=A0ABR9ZYL6_9FIRM|nr:efflux RND transporter periplasmic adaptor subunit [Fusibacter ferrireducens]MBF4694980.1 HlyD family secretion protein [Fusibacter ferrireducens]
MKKVKAIMSIVLLVLIVGGAYWGYQFYYQSSHYFITENAQVSANMITVTPEITGKVDSWNIKEGDMIKEGAILGVQDVSMLLSSNVINPAALSSSADAIVSKAEIKAPISGKVIHTTIVEGQVLSPGMEAAIIADTEHIFIKANVEETDIFKIEQGQTVDITVDAFGNKPFYGYVQSIGQATQSVFSPFPTLNTSGNFTKQTQLIPVKISIINDEGLILMPGMNTKVKIHVK